MPEPQIFNQAAGMEKKYHSAAQPQPKNAPKRLNSNFRHPP